MRADGCDLASLPSSPAELLVTPLQLGVTQASHWYPTGPMPTALQGVMTGQGAEGSMHTALWVIWWPSEQLFSLAANRRHHRLGMGVQRSLPDGPAKPWASLCSSSLPTPPPPPAHHPHHPPGLEPRGSDKKHAGKRTCASICPHSLQTYLSPRAPPPSSAPPTGLAHR